MDALQLERKLNGLCTQCGSPAGDTNLCGEHQRAMNRRVSEHNRRARAARKRSARRAARYAAKARARRTAGPTVLSSLDIRSSWIVEDGQVQRVVRPLWTVDDEAA